VLAQKLCANCHVVTRDPPAAASTDVPSFRSIASRADATAERIAGRIIIPHPAMPTAQLTVTELRDLIAYIQSLKSAR
jgi:mono/diheme cytochrome c family protein